MLIGDAKVNDLNILEENKRFKLSYLQPMHRLISLPKLCSDMCQPFIG